MDRTMRDRCLRCGKCCYIIPGKQFCPKLRIVKEGPPRVTECIDYENRLKLKLPFGTKCTTRNKSKFDFIGCPYNKHKKIFTLIKSEDWDKIPLFYSPLD